MNQSPHEPAKDQTPPDDADGLRLEIEPVIVSAKEIEEHVHTTLPTHTGLGKAATGIRRASEKAQQVSRQLSRKIGWHRLPAAFLFLSCHLLSQKSTKEALKRKNLRKRNL